MLREQFRKCIYIIVHIYPGMVCKSGGMRMTVRRLCADQFAHMNPDVKKIGFTIILPFEFDILFKLYTVGIIPLE